jgi:curved DNA-binding protein CbpA
MAENNHKVNKNRREKKSNKLDYYEVFGLPKTASKKEIIIKYRELVKKYHPDKSPLNGKLFEVIQRAWECLSNDERRKNYDNIQDYEEKAKKSDHIGLKKSYDIFNELSKGEISEEKKKLAENEFKKLTEEFDTKIKYDRTLEKEVLGVEDTHIKMNNIRTLREQDEIEYSQIPIFKEGDTFDPKTFNKAFDKYKNTQNTQVIKKESLPFAFNDSGNNNFSTFDVFEDPFGDTEVKNTNIYSSIDIFNEPSVEISADDLKSIRNSSIETKYDTCKTEKLTDDDLQKLVNDRHMETTKYNNVSFNDFVGDDKNNMFLHEVDDISGSLTFDGGDDDDELVDACNRLIELEKGITGTNINY